MKWVLDTNAVSETAKPRPNPGLLFWHNSQEPSDLLITAITLAEVWQGFHSLDSSHRDYERIKRFASTLPKMYRLLNFDERAAAVWGELIGKSDALFPLRDSFIGAIALSRGHRVVTRDVAVFQRMGCRVINPWT